MKKLRNHLIGLDQGDVLLFSDFKSDGAMWAETGAREVRKSVAFREPFKGIPAVTVGISMWDVDVSTNLRADISAEVITEEGFEIVFKTWGDSKLARIRANWMAFGEHAQSDDWDVD
jgi:hypothetical protein